MVNTDTAPAAAAQQPEVDRDTRTFSVSVLLSAVRCMLTYVILPFVLPFVGLSGAVGPALGLAVGMLAIGFNVFTIRRFRRVDHRLKRPVTIISSGIIVMLLVLAARDIADLIG